MGYHLIHIHISVLVLSILLFGCAPEQAGSPPLQTAGTDITASIQSGTETSLDLESAA